MAIDVVLGRTESGNSAAHGRVSLSRPTEPQASLHLRQRCVSSSLVTHPRARRRGAIQSRRETTSNQELHRSQRMSSAHSLCWELGRLLHTAASLPPQKRVCLLKKAPGLELRCRIRHIWTVQGTGLVISKDGINTRCSGFLLPSHTCEHSNFKP